MNQITQISVRRRKIAAKTAHMQLKKKTRKTKKPPSTQMSNVNDFVFIWCQKIDRTVGIFVSSSNFLLFFRANEK